MYDFGGGTFDAALVRRTPDGFALIGRPEGMERFGGIDIDAAIVAHVDQVLDGALSAMDPEDPAVQAGVARLRDDCRAAKEALSGDTDTTITVSLPGLQTEVPLSRAELEEMVRPRLRETVEALQRAVASAGLAMTDVSRILLVGGSSRIPLVAETIQRDTGRPVAVDAHPKFAIALGAAVLGQTPVSVERPADHGDPGARSAAPATPPPTRAGAATAPAAPRPAPPGAAAATGQRAAGRSRSRGVAHRPVSRRRRHRRRSRTSGCSSSSVRPSRPIVLVVVGVVVFGGSDPKTTSPTEETFDTTEVTETIDTTDVTETIDTTDVTDTIDTTDVTDTFPPPAEEITGDQLRASLITLDEVNAIDPGWTVDQPGQLG